MNVYLELFGYFGTFLILLSMMMTSITKLRVVNMIGSVVSATYAALMGTYPVVLLNIGLILINTLQLIRYIKSKRAKEKQHEADR